MVVATAQKKKKKDKNQGKFPSWRNLPIYLAESCVYCPEWPEYDCPLVGNTEHHHTAIQAYATAGTTHGERTKKTIIHFETVLKYINNVII